MMNQIPHIDTDKLTKIFTTGLIIIISFIPFHTIGFSQILGFYPNLDTVVITNGYCLTPLITAHFYSGDNYIDTIFIEPDTFSVIGNWTDDWEFEEYEPYFLIADTLDQFDYELHFDSNYPFVFPFDSSIACIPRYFFIKLMVSVQNSCVDSLSQMFKSIYGLGTNDEPDVLLEFKLFQNYPNPFNPTTTIHYDLPQRSDVQITIYDLLGRKMTTLISETQNAGYKSVQWDASNISSGMFFYQIKAGDFTQTKK